MLYIFSTITLDSSSVFIYISFANSEANLDYFHKQNYNSKEREHLCHWVLWGSVNPNRKIQTSWSFYPASVSVVITYLWYLLWKLKLHYLLELDNLIKDYFHYLAYNCKLFEGNFWIHWTYGSDELTPVNTHTSWRSNLLALCLPPVLSRQVSGR